MATAVETSTSRRPVIDRRPARLGFTVSAGLLGALSLVGAPPNVEPPRPGIDPIAPPGLVVDEPAPFLWDSERNQRVGAKATRFELDDPNRTSDMSAWYHLTAVIGSDQLQVYEHTPPTTQGPESDIARTQNVAWHVATSLLGRTRGLAQPGEIPDWARPHTGNANGPSAGLLYALADLDILTPGPLAGDLRVAGTGQIFSDGTITSVRLVEAKLAAARLAHPDVFFAPDISPSSGAITLVVSHQGTAALERTIGDWLNTAGYETAGRIAATQPGRLALVTVSDVRQALAWLCGRTQRPATCTLAHTAAATPVGSARSIKPPSPNPREPTRINPGPQ